MKKLLPSLIVALLGLGGHSIVQGAQQNERPNDLLRDAVDRNDYNGVKRAIKLGADRNLQIDRDNETILWLAAAQGHMNSVKALVESGAEVNAYGGYGSGITTPLDEAENTGHHEIANYLKKHGAHNYSRRAPHAPVQSSQPKKLSIKKPMERRQLKTIDVHARDAGGKTILFMAAKDPNPMVTSKNIPTLINLGADVDARDNHGNTALHNAAWFNQPIAVRWLVHAGADINARDRNGNTPLDKARINKSKEAEKALIELGADKDQPPAYEPPPAYDAD